MNGLAATGTDLSFAPIYQEILDLGTYLRSAGSPGPRRRDVGCGRSKLALDSIEPLVGGGRCHHAAVLRQRYETSSAELDDTTHELGYA